MLRNGWALVGVGAGALLVSGCQKEVVARPTITLVAPVDGATHDATSMDVTVLVEGFTLSPIVLEPPTSELDRTGTPYMGHWHLYLDFNFVGDEVVPSATLFDLTPGTHSIIAELVNQNHFPVLGTPLAEVTVLIPDSVKGVTITSPPSGTFYSSSSVDVYLEAQNFVLDSAAIGQANVPGRGHVHLYRGAIDGANLVADGAGAVQTVTDIDTTGADPNIALFAALVNNDHTPFDPPPFDRVDVQVSSSSPRLSIVTPIANELVGAPIDVKVQVANFQLFDFAGTTGDSAGKGHYHVLVDGVDVGHAFTTSAGGFAASPGAHSVRVELRGNLHQPLAPPVADLVPIIAQ